MEAKKGLVVVANIEKRETPECVIDIEVHSKVSKLYRVTAYVRRFIV